ncbi:MAG: DUF4290 domain-containing protein [Flavobacteriales bacterium]|nr:DUF4290 domain-containing protein [Flavobacteriales bacterium]
MDYNTGRYRLAIPEYGRNVQKMVAFASEITDKEERNNVAKIIVDVMGQINSQNKNLEGYEQKLWNHLFIISDFKLDVESPYEKPTKEALAKRPERVAYRNSKIRYKHYGVAIQSMIDKCILLPEGDEKTAFTNALANHMKTSYLNWNIDSVNDEVITNHLKELSDDKLTLSADFSYISTAEVLAKNPSISDQRKRNGGKNKNKNSGRNRKRY